MEKLKSDGLAKWDDLTVLFYCHQIIYRTLSNRSIGVSNFGVEDLKTLLASAKIKPVVNQVTCIFQLDRWFPLPDTLVDPLSSVCIRPAGPDYRIWKREWNRGWRLQSSHVCLFFILESERFWQIIPLDLSLNNPAAPSTNPWNNFRRCIAPLLTKSWWRGQNRKA